MGLPAAPYRPTALAHRLAVADLAAALLAGHPGARWVGERELRRDGLATVRDRRDGRLLGGAPHVPDGVLLLPGTPDRPGAPDRPGGGAVAVELERTPKPPGEDARILRWDGGALAYERVVWFAATEALRRRLAELIARERLDDFIPVQALPAQRLGAGLGLSDRVGRVGRDVWTVPSQTEPGKVWEVFVQGHPGHVACTCPAGPTASPAPTQRR